MIDLDDQYLKTLFLGIGKTRISLVLLLCVNLVNVPLNYLFIFGWGPIPAMGVAGLRILRSPRYYLEIDLRDGWVFDRELIRRILHLGGLRSLQGVVRNFSGLMTVRIITLLPDATRAVSAYSVGIALTRAVPAMLRWRQRKWMTVKL